MEIHPLLYQDLHLLSSLQPEGWADIMPFFKIYTTSAYCFPIKALSHNNIVGIGTTIIHNDIAWLAHIIVDSNHRNKGIGQFITQTLINSLSGKCETIYLIATDLGAPVYQKIGFETETEYLFFKDIKFNHDWKISQNISPFTDQIKEQIVTLDQESAGENRIFQFEQYLANAYVYLQSQTVEGFYLPTFGEGLIIANTSEAGLELMKLRFKTKNTASFPVDNIHAYKFMSENNFPEFKRAKRMRLGKEKVWLPQNLFNRIGGNLG